MYNSLILFILLPGIVAFFVMALGSYFGRRGSFFLTTSSIGLAWFIICLIVNIWIIPGSLFTYKYFFWIKIGYCTIQWGFLIDSLSSIMLFIVSFISFLVHLYSIDYMKTDPHANRFMAYLSLFTFFMFILITSDNFLQLFLGWEGVGLCSYLLVSFWYTRITANKAAIKALIINRIGDIALLLAMAILYHQFKTLNYAVIFSICHYFEAITYSYFNYNFDILSLISFFIFFGAVGKSAQLGLHTWLPDAMEGPTPVSALIHAATMVTAGVFLLIRCSPLLEYAPTILIGIALIGSLTTFFAASIGLVQTDIKKIIAYSTCSQLGYMILACGLSNYTLALYHLLTHAFFKALLFLSAGSIIHATGDEQDYRKMGGLLYFLPLTYSTMLIGSCAIMGLPYLAGYYSKDLILEVNFIHSNCWNSFLQPLLLISTMLTIIYSLKLLFQAFLTLPNSYKLVYQKIHEPHAFSFLLVPLIILAICSIFSGYLFQEIFSISGNIFFNNTIFTRTLFTEMEFFNWEFKVYIFWLTFFLIVWSLFYYIMFIMIGGKFSGVQNPVKQYFQGVTKIENYNGQLVFLPNLPFINIWWEFYLLKILFVPLIIEQKWFSKKINAVVYYDIASGTYNYYKREQIEAIVNRPIWQYQYAGLEGKSIFFNVNWRALFIYFLSLHFMLDLFYTIAITKQQTKNCYTNLINNTPKLINKYRYYLIYSSMCNNFFKTFYAKLRNNWSGIFKHIWFEFYLLKILFIPFTIAKKWFLKQIPQIVYYDIVAKAYIYYSPKQVEAIINRPIWQYKYLGLEEKKVFFNMNAWILNYQTACPTTWYFNFFQIPYNQKNLLFYYILGFWRVSFIRQLYGFFTNICFEELSLGYIYQSKYRLKHFFPIRVYSWTAKDWLSVPFSFVITNIDPYKLDLFSYNKLEKMKLSFLIISFKKFFFFYFKKELDLPLINIWFEFYLLKILFIPFTIAKKWFLKQIPQIVYYDIVAKAYIYYSPKQVEAIINRPIWQYKYLGLEEKKVFFNLEVKNISFFRIEEFTISGLFKFFVSILHGIRKLDILFYYLGIFVININFFLLHFYFNFFTYHLGTIVLIIVFYLTNLYIGIIRYLGFVSINIILRIVRYSDIIRVGFWNSLYIYFFDYYFFLKLVTKIYTSCVVYWQNVFLILQILKIELYRSLSFYVPQIFYLKKGLISVVYFNFTTFLAKKWFFDIFQNQIVYYLLSKIQTYFYLLFEKGLFELFGPTGLTKLTVQLSQQIIRLHKTKIAFFSVSIFYSIIIFYFILCYLQ